MKYSKEICDRIIVLAESDEYTQKELSQIVGIDEDTFINWKKTHSDFSDAYENAKQRLREKRLVQCSRSLSKLINGFESEEERTEYIKGDNGKPVIRAQYVVKKHVAPSLGAIIHYQSNMDPEHWKNKQRFELTGKDGDEIKLAPLSAEELEILSSMTK